jgi:ankyrin repeat protein
MIKLVVTCAVVCAITTSLLAQDPKHPDKPSIRLTADFWRAMKKGDLAQMKSDLARDKRLVSVREEGHGAMPLHLASNVDVAKLLLENGADLEALDTANFATPLRWAVSDKRWEVAKFLRERGAKVDDIFLACALGDVDRVTALVKQDPPLLEKPGLRCDLLGDGEHATEATRHELGHSTPLHVAVNASQAKVVKALLDLGANPKAEDEHKVTMLHSAAWSANPEVIEALVKAGVALDPIEEEHHNTPLGWAVVAGKPENVKALIAAGAKVNPGFLQDAEEGKRGDFKDFAPGKPADYEKISELLKQRVARSTSGPSS